QRSSHLFLHDALPIFNLGLDSFVFVDDNPLELEEVSQSLPEVRTVKFPTNDDGIPDFFDRLSDLFARSVVTAEDAERTEMYRRRDRKSTRLNSSHERT